MLDFSNNPWAFPVEAQPIFDQFGNEIDGNIEANGKGINIFVHWRNIV